MQNPESQKLLQRESKYIQKLNKIVEEAIKQERLIVSELPKPNEDTASFGQDISDKVAKFGGSWKFIISFFVIISP